jgi:hypothetical protein
MSIVKQEKCSATHARIRDVAEVKLSLVTLRVYDDAESGPPAR